MFLFLSQIKILGGKANFVSKEQFSSPGFCI